MLMFVELPHSGKSLKISFTGLSEPNIDLLYDYRPSHTAEAPHVGDDATDKNDAMYELFAVVCHKGQMQGGHYISYLRCGCHQLYVHNLCRLNAP